MSVVAAAIVGSAVVGYAASQSSADAAKDAAGQQSAAAQAGIDQQGRSLDEQKRQFDSVRALLQPYVTAGQGGLTGQQDLLGINGNGAQQSAINGIQNGAQFQSLKAQGENSILQNASATGGLRGGNVQGALGQFSPALLSQLIDQQYGRLGGLAAGGQNAAAGVGNAGMAYGNSVTGINNNTANLLQQQGAAQAGGTLSAARGNAQGLNSLASGASAFAGYGGFGGTGFTSLFQPAVTDGGYSVGQGAAYGGGRAGM
jgi:hypothetical protein